MAYSAEISRNNPSCFLFVIDQSGSMADNYVSVNKPKSEALSDVINRMLQQLVIKCAKSEGVRIGLKAEHDRKNLESQQTLESIRLGADAQNKQNDLRERIAARVSNIQKGK